MSEPIVKRYERAIAILNGSQSDIRAHMDQIAEWADAGVVAPATADEEIDYYTSLTLEIYSAVRLLEANNDV